MCNLFCYSRIPSPISFHNLLSSHPFVKLENKCPSSLSFSLIVQMFQWKSFFILLLFYYTSINGTMFFPLPICPYLVKNKNCLQHVYKSSTTVSAQCHLFFSTLLFLFFPLVFFFAGHLPGFVLLTKRIPENPKKIGSTSIKWNTIYNWIFWST